ncbi:methionine sulfoxide reductase A [Geobacillus sp. LEMMJ02]|uniref:Methionine sulfoxide reductase A n=1 Tax=Geobacillus thermoleovorans TaxID=33941 RepID=A0A2Z3N8D3_GEOTH|nr:methionine sulfoxide reductase A [Geobacillus thermoleovorans]OQP13715.1 methionine sulfoxide reductase A [Geobacillus thermoleovorans]QCK83817.1 methionine sulfoxide reductase A [Geobacillus kaustophilus NBRC 102445]TLS32800.1 methionine sulfoxide reductase A [Geobacillus thermoleovorans]TRY43723.1 methionine sulfoxide reductase A [Geobacillus sp. LEMMJ02]
MVVKDDNGTHFAIIKGRNLMHEVTTQWRKRHSPAAAFGAW